MPTSWQEILDLGARDPAPGAAEEAPAEEGSGVFRRLRESLSKSRRALTEEISASLFERLDDEAWERLEEALILADVGAPTTAKVVERLEQEVEAGTVSADGEAVRERLIEILAEVGSTGRAPIDLSGEPAVLLMVGVNGTGKTTTIGKIAWHLSKEFGLSVILAAADTYRAAAAEQLAEWAERAGAELIRSAPGGDPGAVAYDAIDAARARSADVVIVDTAGRLHTEGNLMEELAKVGQGDRQADPRRSARDADLDRRHHRPERPAAGEGVLRRGRGRRRRPHQARRDGEGRDHPGDRRRAGHPGEADRHRRVARGPQPLRPGRLRLCGDRSAP